MKDLKHRLSNVKIWWMGLPQKEPEYRYSQANEEMD
jgi:hypothetical protein